MTPRRWDFISANAGAFGVQRRGLYDALSKGDVPGVLAKLAPEVIVDEPGHSPTAASTRAARCSSRRSWAR